MKLKTLIAILLPLLACAQTPANMKGPPPPLLQVPKEELVQVALEAIPNTQTTMDHVLPKQPAPNTVIEIIYEASVWGCSKTLYTKPDPTQTAILQRTLRITLPDCVRPFAAADRFIIKYKTLDP